MRLGFTRLGISWALPGSARDLRKYRVNPKGSKGDRRESLSRSMSPFETPSINAELDKRRRTDSLYALGHQQGAKAEGVGKSRIRAGEVGTQRTSTTLSLFLH